MRLTSNDKELNKKWRPILRGWLKELPGINTAFSIELFPTRELDVAERGRFEIDKATILLPVGRNNMNEIKFCFFHEIKHWLQLLNGTLSMSIWRSICFDHNKVRIIERDANKFAMKYQPYRNEYIIKSLRVWGLK